MASSISVRQGGNIPVYILRYNRETGTVTPDLAQQKIDMRAKGGAVLLLDWAEPSNNLTIETQTVADKFYDYIFGDSSHWIDYHNPAEIPIHLIGHSRGGSLVSRMAYRLAQMGIFVDQMTTLDPHPVGSLSDGQVDDSDQSATCYENTIYSDNYWRNDGISEFGIRFDGKTVSGAHNSDLNGIFTDDAFDLSRHSRVHTYYHGTIDDLASHDGAGGTINSGWYPVEPRSAIGYNSSRFGKRLTRSTEGTHQSILGGAGERALVYSDTKEWPNVAFDQANRQFTYFMAQLGATAGESLYLPYWFGDQDSSSTITFFLDVDTNPFNNDSNRINIGSNTHSMTDGDIQSDSKDCVVPISTPAGDYYIGAEATDGTFRKRFDYVFTPVTIAAAPQKLALSPSEPFASSGPAGGPFTPVSKTCTVSNQGGASIAWTATGKPIWLNLSATGSTLAAGGTYNLVATINSTANTLTAGTHSATIKINGVGPPLEIPVTLVVFAAPPLPGGFAPIPSSSFLMGTTEVAWLDWHTVRDWATTHGYTDLGGKGSGKADTHPVQTVSWYEVVKWCNARTEYENWKNGLSLTPCYTVSGNVYRTDSSEPDCNWNASGYRLPTSAEWVQAARGGLSGLRFPWGDTINHDHANYRSGSFSYESPQNMGYHPDYAVGGTPYTAPVISFPKNEYNIYNMSGNVWEWCWDLGGTSPNRMLRGGGWWADALQCSLNYYAQGSPAYKKEDLGFRLAKRAVSGQVVQTPVTVSPGSTIAPGTAVSNLTPALSWSAVSAALGYGVSVRDTSSDYVVYSNSGLSVATSVSLPSGILIGGKTYAWKARARDNYGWSDYSTERFFLVPTTSLPRPLPSLEHSLSSGDLTSNSATVRWTWPGNLANTTGISIAVRNLATDEVSNTSQAASTSGYYTLGGLSPATPYRINIAYNGQPGYSIGSEDLEFHTRFPAPTLTSPASGTTINVTVENPVNFAWQEYSGLPVGARIQISSASSGFSARTGWSNPVFQDATTGANYQWRGGVDGQTYWWSVHQASSTGSGPPTSYYSTPKSFVYNAVDTALPAPVFNTPYANISQESATITWSWTGNPANSAGIRVSVWRPSDGVIVRDNVTLPATESSYTISGLTRDTSYQITVSYLPQIGYSMGSATYNWRTRENAPPGIQSVATPSMLADGRIRVDFAASDTEGDPLTCQIWLIRSNGLQVTNSNVLKGAVSNGSNTVYFTTNEISSMLGFVSGTYRVWVMISDPLHNTATNAAQSISPSFSYLIPNSPPAFNSDPILSNCAQGSPLLGQLAATDPDPGDSLTFSLVSGPDWLAVSSTGELTGTPMNDNIGTNTFLVRVTDSSGEYATASLVVTVVNTNDAPVFVVSPIIGSSATENSPYSGTVAGAAMDADAGDTITYRKVTGPAWLSIASNGELSGVPINDDVGVQEFLVRATDNGGASSIAILHIQVMNVNDAPVFTPKTVSLGVLKDTHLETTVLAADIDLGDTIIYSKSSGPDWLAVAPDGTVSGLPTATDVGHHSMVIKASDSAGLFDEITVLVTVYDTSAIWVNSSGGSWSASGNWLNGNIGIGANVPADFSTLNLTADTIVTLDGALTIGGLKFGDSTPSHNWSLNTGSAGPLTLAASPSPPVVEVVSQTVTIGAAIAGSNGLIKSGAGTLKLTAENAFSGETIIDSGILELADTTDNSIGTVRGTVTVNPGTTLIASTINALGKGTGVKVNTLNLNRGTAISSVNGDNGWGLTLNLTGGILSATNSGYFCLGDGSSVNSLASTAPSIISAAIRIREGNTNNLLKFSVDDGPAAIDLSVSGALSSYNAASPGAAWGLEKAGMGTMSLTGANTYVGTTVVSEGTLQVGDGGTSGNLGTGSVTNNAALVFNRSDATTVPNLISGTGTLTKSGTGTLTLPGPNTYTGATTITEGRLMLSGPLASTVVVNGGTLEASGTPVTSGGLTLGSLGNFAIVAGDTLSVGGEVTLAGTLDLAAASGLASGTRFTLLSKTGTGAIYGAFAGISEGSLFTAAGKAWHISYLGGDGNDVVLTVAHAIEDWRTGFFGSPDPIGDAADDANPDGDGWTNFEEFQNGTHPLQANASVVTITSPTTEPVTLASVGDILHAAAIAPIGAGVAPVWAWSVLSGPAGAMVESAGAATATISFPSAGTYVVQASASSGNGAGIATGTATRTVIVAPPASFTLRQGENSYEHGATFIRGDGANTAWNSGGRDQMIVGRTAGNVRMLFSFGLASLPAGFTPQSARLSLWTAAIAGSAGTGTTALSSIKLYPLHFTPTEGTGLSTSATDAETTSGANWTRRTNASDAGNWKLAGCGPGTAASADYAPTLLSTMPGFLPTALNSVKTFPSQPAFADVVRAAITAGKPLDLIAIAESTETAGVANVFARFHSDDASEANALMRPVLVLGFSANPLPVIDCGAAPAAVAGSPINLAGSASADATSSAWSLVSGPGTVVFNDPSLAAAQATFSTAGNYSLRFRASNASGTVSRLLSVTVTDPVPDPGTFAGWQEETWPGVLNADLIAASQDPDGDGMNNLLEWAMHGNAKTPDHFDLRLTQSATPGKFDFSYTRRKTSPGQAIFVVEWSNTLGGDWSAEGVGTEVTSPFDATSESVTVTIPANGMGRRFVRVKVVKP
jgi:autotransporter-associated beta strand protein